MEANELRIGNWVRFRSETGSNEVVQVKSINPFGFTVEGDEVFHNEKYDGPVEPIPLTPEILEACGFKNGKLGKFIFGYDIHKQITIAFDSTFIKLKYLHQFQNLFFCLSGKELDINLQRT